MMAEVRRDEPGRAAPPDPERRPAAELLAGDPGRRATRRRSSSMPTSRGKNPAFKKIYDAMLAYQKTENQWFGVAEKRFDKFMILPARRHQDSPQSVRHAKNPAAGRGRFFLALRRRARARPRRRRLLRGLPQRLRQRLVVLPAPSRRRRRIRRLRPTSRRPPAASSGSRSAARLSPRHRACRSRRSPGRR